MAGGDQDQLHQGQLTEEERERQQIYGELEQKAGYEFYQHSLNLDQPFRKSEAQFDIDRLSAQTKLTDEEKEALLGNAPPPPSFEVRSESDVKRMGHFTKKGYDRKVKAYKKTRAAWEDSRQAGAYYGTRDSVQHRIDYAERQRQEAETITS